MKVTALAYIGCEVSDAEAWEKLLVPIFGLQRREDSPEGVSHYRMDACHHRLSLHESDQDKLAYIGWEVASQQALDALVKKLKDARVSVEHADARLCEQRAVMDMYICEAPDNIRTELFFGLTQEYQTFKPGRGISGFNTNELGLGHIVLACSDREATVKWYQEKLGFALSDHIFWDGIEATFLHCNPRHHSLALSNTVEGLNGGDLGHFMFELNSLDDVGQAYDLVNQQNYPLALTLGRHTNDLMTSFYVYSPSGWWIEYGYGGREINDADWSPKFYNSPKIWGHDMLPPPEGSVKKI